MRFTGRKDSKKFGDIFRGTMKQVEWAKMLGVTRGYINKCALGYGSLSNAYYEKVKKKLKENGWELDKYQ